RLDRMHDLVALAVAAGPVSPHQRVAAPALMGQGPADVVPESAPPCQWGIQAPLSGPDPRDARRLAQVFERVLSAPGGVAQPPAQREEWGVHAGDSALDQRVLGRAQAQPLHLAARDLKDLLDAVRVDAPVEHELFQREPADLTPDRIETGEQNRLGSVVD